MDQNLKQRNKALLVVLLITAITLYAVALVRYPGLL